MAENFAGFVDKNDLIEFTKENGTDIETVRRHTLGTDEAITTLSSGISTIDPEFAERNPREAEAELLRIQQEYAKQAFLPIEERLIGEVTRDIEPEADRAGDITRAQFAQSRESSRRGLASRGISLSEPQRAGIERRRAITESKGIATAENLTRRGLEDRNRNLLGNLAGLGKGIATSSLSALGTASGAQSQREATGAQLQAQRKASQIGGAAAGAGLGFQIGGPVGAGIGALGGYLLG